MRILTLADIAEVDAVKCDPDIYDALTDDWSPKDPKLSTAAVSLLTAPNVLMLSPASGIIFTFARLNGATWEGHISVIREARGKEAIAAARETITWMFTQTSARKIVGFTPVFNRPAVLFSKLVGFKQEGRIIKSWLKNGVLHDQIVFGLCKEDWHG